MGDCASKRQEPDAELNNIREQSMRLEQENAKLQEEVQHLINQQDAGTLLNPNLAGAH